MKKWFCLGIVLAEVACRPGTPSAPDSSLVDLGATSMTSDAGAGGHDCGLAADAGVQMDSSLPDMGLPGLDAAMLDATPPDFGVPEDLGIHPDSSLPSDAGIHPDAAVILDAGWWSDAGSPPDGGFYTLTVLGDMEVPGPRDFVNTPGDAIQYNYNCSPSRPSRTGSCKVDVAHGTEVLFAGRRMGHRASVLTPDGLCGVPSGGCRMHGSSANPYQSYECMFVVTENTGVVLQTETDFAIWSPPPTSCGPDYQCGRLLNTPLNCGSCPTGEKCIFRWPGSICLPDPCLP